MYYNPELTVKENLEVLRQNGIEVCEKTLYNYCKDRGIETGVDFKKLIDPNLSSRKNLDLLKAQGYKIGINKVQKLLKEIKDRQP